MSVQLQKVEYAFLQDITNISISFNLATDCMHMRPSKNRVFSRQVPVHLSVRLSKEDSKLGRHSLLKTNLHLSILMLAKVLIASLVQVSYKISSCLVQT